jgi:hypothetical protein
MRYVRMPGLCLLAVFAVAAVASASASAKTPEWGKCTKVTAGSGKYGNAGCTEKAGSKEYEWQKQSSNVKFTSKNAAEGEGGVLAGFSRGCENEAYEHFEATRLTRAACTAKGGHFNEVEVPPGECREETATGEQTGKSKLADVHVTFTGCLVAGEIPCNSPGAAAEEIQTSELKGELGYINKTTTPVQVGVLLEPAKKHGAFIEWECPNLGLDVVVGAGNNKEGAYYEPEKTGGYDGIISSITPVNTMTQTFDQVYAINPETRANEPSNFEGEHIELLEDYFYFPYYTEGRTQSWSRFGEEVTNVNTTTQASEIKA